MPDRIKPTTPGGEYYFKEGCYIEEWLNTDQHEDMSVARVRLSAHSTTRLHCLQETVERYVILAGEGNVSVADRSWLVKPKDVVVIQPGEAQKIENLTGQDLLFLAICTPRFELKNYLDLEQLA